MAVVGAGALIGQRSYISVGQETTWGTGVTCTSSFDFLSCSIKTTQEAKVIEQISKIRNHSQSISLTKKVEGDLEFYYQPDVTGLSYLLKNAFGGLSVTSATATGETIGGSAMTHTFAIGNFDATRSSLSINNRKGQATDGKVYEYNGVRVNEFTFSAEIEDALKCSCSIIAKDSTVTTNDISSALTITASEVLSFVNGRFSVENTFASLTSATFWHVQNMEFKMMNNLNSDNDARRIGSQVLQSLHAGMQGYELSCSIRFDTTTAYDAMLSHENLAAEFEFLGSTYTGSACRRGIKIRFPKVRISEASEPEISGPADLLKSDVTFVVLRDDSSATGYAVKALVTNNALTI